MDIYSGDFKEGNTGDGNKAPVLPGRPRTPHLEALGLFAGVTVHEYRNLLQVLINGCELLRRTLPDEPLYADTLDCMLRAAGRGTALSRTLMNLVRQQPERPGAPCADLDGVVADLSGILGLMMGSGIRVEMRLSCATNVAAEEVHIQQILINLAANARDAMPQGGVLSIRTQNCSAAQAQQVPKLEGPPRILLSVADNGTGMNEEAMGRLFEPFFSGRGGEGGTGLGLYTVQAIVRHLGGDIEVSSRPGAGTEFRIYLPARGHERVEVLA